jgi:hypothetical protein
VSRPPAVLLVCLVALTGCGIADYEKQMDRERARIKFFDKENKHLGDVLEMPTRKVKEKVDDRIEERDAPAWPFEIFLRLPKEIQKTVAEKTGVHQAPPLVFGRYPGADETVNVIVTAALVGVRDDKVKPKPDDWPPPEEFRDQVRLGLGAMVKKSLHARKFEKVKLVPQNYLGEKQAAIDFDRLSYELPLDPKDVKKDQEGKEIPDAVLLDIYLHYKSGRQVAIGFQQLKSKADAAWKEAVERSLKSLDTSDQALARRNQYQKTKR